MFWRLFRKKRPKPQAKCEEVSMFNTQTELEEVPVEIDHTKKTANEAKKKLRWLIQKPPEGAVLMEITPCMAEAMLEKNERNRGFREKHVRFLAQEIVSGAWIQNGETVVFSSEGVLLDGQHRLKAVLGAGKSIESMVVFGAHPDSFKTIDVGAGRSASDIFAIAGLKNSAQKAAAALIVWGYQNDRARASIKGGVLSKQALLDFATKQEPHFSDFVDENTTLSRQAKFVAPAVFLATYYICWKQNQGKADLFFYSLATGNDIGSKARNNPINRARDKLQEAFLNQSKGVSVNRVTMAAWVIKAWNAYRAGKPLTKLFWRTVENPDEPFPRAH
jgi:hypothetical protein